MEALNDLVKAGKVRALGASAMYGYQFYNMQLVAKEHGMALGKGVSAPIIGAIKAAHLDDAAKALVVKLTLEDISYLEEPYVPHWIVGAIDHNPADGVMLLDEKK